MDETPQRVLVVVPHPDDAEFWCGGTVARWTADGALVRYVVCTDGGNGAAEPGVSSQELAAVRQAEQAEAAQILGVRELVSLEHRDGGLEDNSEFRRELVRQVRQLRPDVVLCPEPYRKNLAWHRDHRIAGQVTLDAVFPYARDHLHFEDLWRDEGLEPHKTGTVLFWGAEAADTLIDIAGTIDAKMRAVRVHRSQLNGLTGTELEEFVRTNAREAAGDSGHQFAEAFRKQSFRT